MYTRTYEHEKDLELGMHYRMTFVNCSEAGRTDEKPYHQKHLLYQYQHQHHIMQTNANIIS